MANAVRQLQKDKRAIERMSTQTLPLLESALSHEDADAVKRELLDLKKRMKDFMKSLDLLK